MIVFNRKKIQNCVDIGQLYNLFWKYDVIQLTMRCFSKEKYLREYRFNVVFLGRSFHYSVRHRFFYNLETCSVKPKKKMRFLNPLKYKNIFILVVDC